MIGIGTIVNFGAIVVGGIIGLFAGKLLTKRFQDIIMVAMGLSIMAMAVSGFVSKMIVISDEGILTQGTYMVIFSLILGAVAGELINIDKRLETFGNFLKRKTGNAKDVKFVEGFVNSSLTVCIGAMAVMGAIMDGINRDPSILFTKAIMDFVIILIMTASQGKGCIFSAIPVAILQGTITLLSTLLAPLLNQHAMNNLSLVGSILILCIGINIVADGRFRIKVANLLPTVVFAVVASYIPFLD